MDLYKIVNADGSCRNGGHGVWPLPVDGEPGAWWDIDGPIEACRNGLHLATADQVPHWIGARDGATVYRVETRGDLIDNGDKWVAQSARLLPRTTAAPDPEPLRLKLERARATMNRRMRSADKLLHTAVPAVWRDYLRSVSTLPAAHPGRVYLATLTDARTAHRDAVAAARVPYDKALAAYNRAAIAALMPE